MKPAWRCWGRRQCRCPSAELSAALDTQSKFLLDKHAVVDTHDDGDPPSRPIPNAKDIGGLSRFSGIVSVSSYGGGADPSTVTGFVDHLVDANNMLVGTSSSAFAPGGFDPTTFTAAIGDLYDFSAFSNLAPDFAAMSADYAAILTSLF